MEEKATIEHRCPPFRRLFPATRWHIPLSPGTLRRPTQRPHRLSLIFLFLLAVLASSWAYSKHAEAAGWRQTQQRSRKWLANGVAALKARDFAAASQALTAAYRSEPGPEILCTMGSLAAAQELWLEAQDLFRRCMLERSMDTPEAAPLAQEARQILERPRPPAGEAMVFGRRGAFVFVDNRLVATLPLPLPLLLSPGRHSVTIESGRGNLSSPVMVPLGRTLELRFSEDVMASLTQLLPAVLVLSDHSALPAAEAAQLSQAMARLIERAHRALFDSRLALSLAPGLAACLKEERCPIELAAPLGIDHVLVSRVGAPADQASDTRRLQLTLFDTVVGDVAASAEQTCAHCSGQQAVEAFSQTLGQCLAQGTARPKGVLEVRSVPAGAEILLDEHSVGVTPYQHAVWAGNYSVRLKKENYESAASTATIESGKTQTVDLVLAQPAPPPAPLDSPVPVVAPPLRLPEPQVVRTRRPRWRLAVGSVTLLSGVATMAFGISALAVSGSCIVPVTAGQCRDYYGTGGVGGALLGVGAALTAGGTVLLAFPEKKKRAVVAIGEPGAGADSFFAATF